MFYNTFGEKMKRLIMHIDVNNAFLSWTAIEMLKKGYEIDIREIPAIIGGDESKRSGIVLAKSMKAKEFGIKTAQTIYEAKRKCPNLRIYPSDYATYKKYSNKLYNLLLQYTDKIERFSIDECFLDMTNFLLNDTIEHKAILISNRIKQELGFTVNIGISNNKVLAKMASDFEKPDKIHTLYLNEIQEKMWSLPVSELFMLGRKTVPKLLNMQIKTIGDLAKTDKRLLIKNFGKHGLQMWEYANGIDLSEVKSVKEKPKVIGNSITLPKNISDLEKLQEIVLALVENTTYRLRKQKLLANTVNVQLRTKEFIDKSHQGKLERATSSTKHIYSKAINLLKEMYINGNEIRLVGISLSNLIDENQSQISLFETENDSKQNKLDKVLDDIKNKYGYNKITRAGKMEVEGFVKLKDI